MAGRVVPAAMAAREGREVLAGTVRVVPHPVVAQTQVRWGLKVRKAPRGLKGPMVCLQP